MKRLLNIFSSLVIYVSFSGSTYGHEGCCYMGAQNLDDGIGPAIRLIPVNISCARTLQEEILWMKRMKVKSSIYMITKLNAFAVQAGEVYLGQPLIDQIISKHGVEYGFHASAYILSHEYSHQFQFRMLASTEKTRPKTPIMELQADILAGYWMGARLKEQDNQLGAGNQNEEIERILKVAKNAAFEVGDYAFDDPSHHGTPAQRHAAVVAGSAAGFSGKFGLSDKAYSENENETYDWSLRKAEEIFKNGER